ncbi:hypothetical protein BJY01DRAFT_220345 [Aspergillus pseudoustus]|uniref:Uncharacterized protein n=1 Tax=Aspergillus pseudoustus TaxID=1810923 RepID=A0ABR4JD22_9EURO
MRRDRGAEGELISQTIIQDSQPKDTSGPSLTLLDDRGTLDPELSDPDWLDSTPSDGGDEGREPPVLSRRAGGRPMAPLAQNNTVNLLAALLNEVTQRSQGPLMRTKSPMLLAVI